MKRLVRPAAPPCLCDGDDAAPAPRKAWYQDLYYEREGEKPVLKDRWNSSEKDQSGVSSIRRTLRQMSRECAWCEVSLEPGWQVDHWLPKEPFPFVAYCWENLLPSCPGCNRRKSKLVPPTLRDQKVVDPVLQGDYPTARAFRKGDLLLQLPERLVDPSHEEPAEHLEFIPPALSWRGKSKVGDFTVRKLLAEKDQAERWAKLSDMVRGFVEAGVPDRIFEILIDFHGQGTIIRALLGYWRPLLGASTSRPNPPLPLTAQPSSPAAPPADPGEGR